MKFKKIDFINFKSKNPITQKPLLIVLMAVFIYYSSNMIVKLFDFIILLINNVNNPSLTLSDLLQTDWMMLISLFLTSVVIILSLLYVKFFERRPLSTTGIVKKDILKQYSIGFLLGILMIGLPVLALLAFGGNVYFNANTDYGLLMLYLLGFLIQGASEEIIVRGYLLTSLAKNTNIFWAILISSLFFSLLHIVNPSMGVIPFINLFLFGVFASVFFLRTKNIWAICALHSAWNFFQGNIFGIQVSGHVLNNSLLNIKYPAPEILSGGEFGLEGGLFVTALLVAATLITVFYGYNKLVTKKDIEA